MTRYIRKSHLETVRVDEEWIVLDTNDFTVTKLNDVGGFCWSLLEGATTVDALAQAVREEYADVNESVAKELERFLSELVECGLVQHAR